MWGLSPPLAIALQRVYSQWMSFWNLTRTGRYGGLPVLVLATLLTAASPSHGGGQLQTGEPIGELTDGPVSLPAAVKWQIRPTLAVCDSAPVTKEMVEMLLAEWVANGAPPLKVVNTTCDDSLPEDGIILVDRWRSEWRELLPKPSAVCSVWPEEPLAGVILLENADLGVLRHELGHIWIHGHAEKQGHVLCPYVDCLSGSWEGIRKSFQEGRGVKTAAK